MMFLTRFISIFATFLCAMPLIKGMRLIFELPDGERMCFHENLNSSMKYIFEYQVTAGGSYDVDVVVTNPSKENVYTQRKSSYGTLYLTVPGKQSNVPEVSGISSVDHSGGHYRFCFSNKFSVVTHKRVYIGILSESDLSMPNPGVKDAAEVATLTQLEYSISSISSSLSNVENSQIYFQLQASRHRSFAKTLNSNVFYYSLMYAIALLCVGIGQVMVLRSFFTEKVGQRNMKVPT